MVDIFDKSMKEFEEFKVRELKKAEGLGLSGLEKGFESEDK